MFSIAKCSIGHSRDISYWLLKFANIGNKETGDRMEILPLLLSWVMDISETKLLALVALGAIGLAFYVIRLIASR